jgi:curved DNA-binding protein CbpA
MATDFDPYRILQVSPEASDDEIRAAYEVMSARAQGDGLTEENARASTLPTAS